MTVAFSVTSTQDAAIKPGSSKLIVAEVDPAGPSLKSQTVILESPDRSCFIEAQDFFPGDRSLTCSCNEPEGDCLAA